MNSFTVQVELCPEDRERLDKILTAVKNWGTPYDVVSEKPTDANATDNNTSHKTLESPVDPHATKDDIRKLVVSISAKGKQAKAAARAVITQYAETITELPEDKLDEIFKALCALDYGGTK